MRSRKSNPCRVVAALALASIARPAVASDLGAAKEAAGRAERAISEGRWCDAVAAFADAHRLSEDPRALFNAGIAAQKGGHLLVARNALGQFLAEAADNPLAPKARERLEAIDAQLAGGAKDAACGVTIGGVAAAPAPAPTPAPAPAPTPAPAPAVAAVEAPVEEGAGSTAGWILLGAGALTFVAGAAFTASAISTRNELEDGAGGPSAKAFDASTQEQLDSFERANVIGTTGLALGLALTAGGVLLLSFAGEEN